MTVAQRDAVRKDTQIRDMKLLKPLQIQKTKITKYLQDLNMTNLKRKLTKRKIIYEKKR